ncbi:hypothetical protein CAMGR0001_0881 [Campylobacter gracilis RM3268]|uniref:Uncharacterized protein n=1 Tax=Campylobacter gracilis RM3268 TaxID=553220 RepID=C8PG87_9BACT|nr:hypothetical protein CAMGR0001_0881 [Campylobacter gracilis RM3268]
MSKICSKNFYAKAKREAKCCKNSIYHLSLRAMNFKFH